MTDHQVLIFGSFTEEELRSLQCEQQKDDVDITFGSLDAETLRSVGIFDNRLTDLHSPRGCDLPTTGKNVCGSPRSTVNTSEFEVSVEQNGSSNNTCSADSVSKELKQCRSEETVSFSSDHTFDLYNQSNLEQHGSHGAVELNLPPNGVVLDYSVNGVHHLETEEAIYKAPNGCSLIPRFFLPRGLVNLGNLCFLNATLQALLSCSPFLELLHELRNRHIPEIGYPTLHAFAEFISDFDDPADSICQRNEKTVLENDRPLRPVMFDSILKVFTPDISSNLSGRPRQEDAQEFLSFIMHQMHDELLKLDGQISNGNGTTASLVYSTDDEGEEDEWEMVGPRKTTAITRMQSFVPSKLSAIFGGQLRSVVKARGNKASATVQPYLLLHLNICPDPVCTVEDALQFFSAPETLEGYRTSTAENAEVVTASKSVKILELSEVMVLHLMRFSYGSEGSTKLHKAVCFPLELVVERELLASPSSEGRSYELVATITHHGRDPSKGHYTADARHPNGKWLRYDDASVTPIPESKVLHDQAYILFYKRL